MNAPAACPLCAAPYAFTAPRETHEDSGTRYELFSCPACGAQFWWPLRNPGGAWYERDERYAARNNDPILTANAKHRGVLAYFKKPGRVLDVGCGVGNFLAYAKAHGWDGWGIDFDRDAIEAGKRAFGLQRLFVADLAAFRDAHPDMRFDLVTFFDVFEHLDNHNEFLKTARSLLVPGGHIALSVPYRHGWHWLMPADVPPRHLTRWDEPSLGRILARHGFSPALVRRLPASLYYLTLKIRFRYGKWASFGIVGKARERASSRAPASAGAPRPALRVRLLALAAKAKDFALFGIPALILWLALLPTRARYTDIWLVAGSASEASPAALPR